MKTKVEILDTNAKKGWKAFSNIQKTSTLPTEEAEEAEKVFNEDEILEEVRRVLLKMPRERSN